MGQPQNEPPTTERRGGGLATVKGFLTRKYGPLPAWAWFLIVFGVALAFYWYRNRQAANTSTQDDGSTNLSDLIATGQPMPYYGGDNYTNTTVNNPPPPDNPVTGDEPTNQGPPAPPPAQQQTTYTVKSGDNLTKIAQQFHTTWQAIWNANQSTITNAAKSHGVKSNYWNYIYPSEKLVIPG